MIQKVIKAGNSTAVTVPSEFVRLVGIKPGDDVEVEVELEHSRITYTFEGAQQLTLSEDLLSKRRKKKKL